MDAHRRLLRIIALFLHHSKTEDIRNRMPQDRLLHNINSRNICPIILLMFHLIILGTVIPQILPMGMDGLILPSKLKASNLYRLRLLKVRRDS